MSTSRRSSKKLWVAGLCLCAAAAAAAGLSLFGEGAGRPERRVKSKADWLQLPGLAAPPAPVPPALAAAREARSPEWVINYHGTCCEGNLAAAGDATYVLLPELLTGNDIKRSLDGGRTWTKQYPPIDISSPFGIEGDLQAFGDDVVFFGTEVTNGVAARSTDRGQTWTTVQMPVAFPVNDQAWAYLGPLPGVCPVQTVPYVLAGWYRIGSVALFSCDGGLTWPIQTPLVGVNGNGPAHVACQAAARPPLARGDTRVGNAAFANMKSGRHGGWGTDRKFYWTQTAGNELFVCKTDNFGATWDGVRHPVAPGPGSSYVVTHAAFDDRGTLYVLHGDKLYVSFDQGESFRFTHTLPRFGNAGRSDSGADQFFAVRGGTIHLGLLGAGAAGGDEVWYVRGTAVDTAAPVWDEELVDVIGDVRLDFVQLALDGNGIPTLSYTTPGRQVTTASRAAPMPCAPLNHASAAYGATAAGSSTYPAGNFAAAGAVDGDRTGANWSRGGGWNDATRGVWPDALEVSFGGPRAVGEVRVTTLQNDYAAGREPDASTPATLYGLKDFDVQAWDGARWVTVGEVRGNDRALRTVTFQSVTTTKIRVLVHAAREHFSRVVEVEALGCGQ